MRRLVVGLAMTIASLAPVAVQADDQQIAKDIVTQLQSLKSSGQLKGFGIDLEVDNGTVWLKGYVADEAQRDTVLDIARHVVDVQQVVNDLTIEAEPEATPAPQPEKAKALTSLAASKLRGLRKQEPVVAAPVQVEPAPIQPVAQSQVSSSDDAIAEAVINKLASHKDAGKLRDFSLDVKVDQGAVWISGRVKSQDQQILVLDTARRVRGVKQVVNDIRVAKTSVQPISNVQPVQAAPAQLAPAPLRVANQTPLAFAPARSTQPVAVNGQPVPEMTGNAGIARARYDHPNMPGYAWPSYSPYPNYGAVTYPKQYSASAWPYIGPFYPYPQVPLGWRNVTLKWKDGWWFLDFKSK